MDGTRGDARIYSRDYLLTFAQSSEKESENVNAFVAAARKATTHASPLRSSGTVPPHSSGTSLSSAVQHLTEHSNAVLYFADTARGELISGSQDYTIKIWDLEFFQCKGTLNGHTGSILSLAVKDNFLFSAGSENKILMWDLDTHQCLAVLSGHVGTIFSIAVVGDRLFCGCQDTLVKHVPLDPIFAKLSTSFNDRLPLQLDSSLKGLIGHHGFVYCLAQSHGRLFSGSGDGTIKIWDTRTLECTKTLVGHRGSVQSLAVDQAHLFSASSDGSVKIWDLDSLMLIRTLAGQSEAKAEMLAVAVSDACLCAGSSTGQLYIWTKNTWQLVSIIHDSSVILALFALPRFIATADSQGAIRVYPVSAIPKPGATPSSEPSVLLDSSTSGDQLVSTLAAFVAFQSVSADSTKRRDCWDAAKWLLAIFEAFGLESHLLEGAEGRNPLVFGQMGNDPRKPTVFIYSHYDVVPALDSQQWLTPPFVLTGKDGYLYGRGATDDKGPIIAILFAISELMDEMGDLPVNIKFLSEGEEETDSSGLKDVLQRNEALFSGADVLLISNTNWIGEDHPCLMYGLRGVIYLQVRVKGAAKNLHSGVNGGGVSEPMIALMHLLSSLVKPNGSVNIPNFYDRVRPLTREEEAMYEQIDLNLAAYCEKFGVKEFVAKSKEELLMKQWRYPTLSIHGVATSSNNNPTSIPQCAEGNISIRFVPDQSAEEIVALTKAHLESEFAKITLTNCTLEVETTKIGDWWLAEHDSVYFKAAEAALSTVWGVQPLYIREGGTIPLTSYMERMLRAPALLLPLGQASDAAHLHNERIRLENLKKGKDVVKEFFKNLQKKVVKDANA